MECGANFKEKSTKNTPSFFFLLTSLCTVPTILPPGIGYAYQWFHIRKQILVASSKAPASEQSYRLYGYMLLPQYTGKLLQRREHIYERSVMFGEVSVTERGCSAPILKVARYISRTYQIGLFVIQPSPQVELKIFLKRKARARAFYTRKNKTRFPQDANFPYKRHISS